ncbi:hypothetical protein ABIA30_002031 [Mycobacterium sp. MAA66]|jgi:hypothetical protein|uniref:LytR C-terminal domain-containing protein n=1 Tax=Mycobacterium sp. MAA66 TaxID=3156297 RepID=UPI0035141EAB
MNQRESSGLPLRAMVMVLLFLGVVFLLVAIQSLTSDGKPDASSSGSSSSVASSAAPTTSTPPAAAKANVEVFNVSEVAGAAKTVTDKLHDAQWNVTTTDNLSVEPVPPATTVYFGDAPGQKDSAEAVAKILGTGVPVAPRGDIPALADRPSDVVIVLVTG